MKDKVLTQTQCVMKSGIVLNRMYVGDYLMSNLGHEVINLFQADNGGNYLYLNSTGDFVKAHKDRVEWMLMVKYHGIGEVEVVGLASGLEDVYNADDKFVNKYDAVDTQILGEQLSFINGEPGGVCYGGASILDIFGEAGQQSVFITYTAKRLLLPRDGVRIFIRFHSDKEVVYPSHTADDVVVVLEGYQQAKASLKQYIYAEGTYKGDLAKQNVEAKKADYIKIREMLIDNTSLWIESNNRVDDEELSDVAMRKISLFDICQIQNDENKFSNALAYFMLRAEYRALWSQFFAERGITMGMEYTITREEASKIEDPRMKNIPSGGRIDLLVRTPESMIVIENKIKSDINSVEEDGEGKQLRRYYNYVNWLTADKESQDYGKNAYYVILTPKYNIPTVEDKDMRTLYRIITYAEVYDYLTAHKAEFAADDNFVAFYEAMYRHTHDNVNDYLYYEMQEKFFRKIKEINNK